MPVLPRFDVPRFSGDLDMPTISGGVNIRPISSINLPNFRSSDLAGAYSAGMVPQWDTSVIDDWMRAGVQQGAALKGLGKGITNFGKSFASLKLHREETNQAGLMAAADVLMKETEADYWNNARTLPADQRMDHFMKAAEGTRQKLHEMGFQGQYADQIAIKFDKWVSGNRIKTVFDVGEEMDQNANYNMIAAAEVAMRSGDGGTALYWHDQRRKKGLITDGEFSRIEADIIPKMERQAVENLIAEDPEQAIEILGSEQEYSYLQRILYSNVQNRTASLGQVTYDNHNAIRNQPIQPKLGSALKTASGATGLKVEIFSGGQPSSGPNRTGSHRHDNGWAADVRLYDESGKRLRADRKEDIPKIMDFIRSARAAGATSIGAGAGYMDGNLHVDFRSGASYWGKDGKSANAPKWLRDVMSEPIQSVIPPTSPGKSDLGEFGGFPIQSHYSGVKVSAFGGQSDPNDNGISGIYPGEPTGTPELQGVAIPEKILKAVLGNDRNAWTQATVRVMHGGKSHAFDISGIQDGNRADGSVDGFKIVDLGTAEWVWNKNGQPVLDMTEGAITQLGGQVMKNAAGEIVGVEGIGDVSFEIIPKGGKSISGLDLPTPAQISKAESEARQFAIDQGYDELTDDQLTALALFEIRTGDLEEIVKLSLGEKSARIAAGESPTLTTEELALAIEGHDGNRSEREQEASLFKHGRAGVVGVSNSPEYTHFKTIPARERKRYMDSARRAHGEEQTNRYSELIVDYMNERYVDKSAVVDMVNAGELTAGQAMSYLQYLSNVPATRDEVAFNNLWQRIENYNPSSDPYQTERHKLLLETLGMPRHDTAYLKGRLDNRVSEGDDAVSKKEGEAFRQIQHYYQQGWLGKFRFDEDEQIPIVDQQSALEDASRLAVKLREDAIAAIAKDPNLDVSEWVRKSVGNNIKSAGAAKIQSQKTGSTLPPVGESKTIKQRISALFGKGSDRKAAKRKAIVDAIKVEGITEKELKDLYYATAPALSDVESEYKRLRERWAKANLGG